MKRPIALVVMASVLLGPKVSILQADISPLEVRQAIDKGVGYLKRMQRSDGSWSDFLGYPGGTTALCTLALLNSGVEPDDPHVKRALGYIRDKVKPEKTYTVALQTMVLCKAKPTGYKLLVSRNVRWLESQQKQATDSRPGAWGYPAASGDNSNSQFALLALHEAERAGVKVSGRTWRLAKTYWEKCQNVDGSWGYYKGVPGTGSMTSAGIASLVIAADTVRPSDAKADGDRITCCVQGEDDDTRLQRSLRWLGERFSVTRNPESRGETWTMYYLYGVERVGRLTARRFIGGHDWYREGAQHLIATQDSLSGFWQGNGPAEGNPLVSTSLALLFLSKGRRPPLMAKLKHIPGDDWNRHRSDVDNLTRFVESRWDRDLTWQVIDLQAAKIEDLLQAPVLYFGGSLNPVPAAPVQRKQLADKLRGYLDRGGFLFAEADCGGGGFDQGFRQLMKQVFPEPEYQLHLLEPGHPIWHAEQQVDAKHVRPLWGIEFGCRTSVVYAPPDPPGRPRPSLSCLWELSRGGREQEFTETVQDRIDAGLSIGINVLAYATNREVRGKEDYFDTVVEKPSEEKVQRARMSVAKLRHPGGCNAAPRALINLLQTAGSQLKIRVDARENLIHITDDTLFDHHLVFMHGRNRFSLTGGERQQLKTFIERGGMLFADSICASKAFTTSFRAEMQQIFVEPGRKLQPIPVDDPLLSTKYGGEDLTTVTRRDPQLGSGTGPLKATLRKVSPKLEGIKFDDGWRVIFSPLDISCALEKHDSLECQGYIREDAARIGLNVILYSLQQ